MFPLDFPCWKSSADLSYQVRTVWSYDEGVYFLIEVVDDKLVPPPRRIKEKVYEWDSIELFFDGLSAMRGKEKFSGIDEAVEQFLIFPPVSTRNSPCRVFSVKDKPSVKIDCYGRKTDRGYLVEGRIKPVNKQGLVLAPGRKFGLDIAVNDADDLSRLKRCKTQMVLYGSKDNYKMTTKYGRFILTFSSQDEIEGYRCWKRYSREIKKDQSLEIYYTLEDFVLGQSRLSVKTRVTWITQLFLMPSLFSQKELWVDGLKKRHLNLTSIPLQ